MNLYTFTQKLKERLENYKNRVGLTYFDNYEIKIYEGKKFFKVFSVEKKNDIEQAGGKHLICFIDKNNGDIYKPASFNAPAKHKRGNVLSPESGMEAFTPDGFVKYLK